MATQTFTAVVLPAGLAAGGKLHANIYLSPRLAGAAQLTSFPDWLAWPDLIQQHGLTFELRCGGNTATVAANRAVLRPDVWREIFPPRTTVTDYPQPHYSQRLVVSYPARDALSFVQYAYQLVARSAVRDGGEDGKLLENLLAPLVFRRGSESTLDQTLSQLRVAMWREQNDSAGPPIQEPAAAGHDLAADAAAPQPNPAQTRQMIERFALYHNLPPAPNRPALPHTPQEYARLLDFHKALSALSAYPVLLPPLGLVFPVDLPDSLCPPSPAGASYLALSVAAVSPGWTWSVSPVFASVATCYVRGDGSFTAAPATDPAGVAAGQFAASDVVDGFLALDADSFQLIGVDIDGALLKAMALADNVAYASDSSLIEPVLPSLRSGGISLIASGRAQQLLQAIADNEAFDSALSSGSSPRPFNARDLVRGYRLDMWSARTNKWYSLHRRDGAYRFGSGDRVRIQSADEEGFTQLAVTQPADDPTRPTDGTAAAAGVPQPGTDLYIHERVARWNGWSLSAPRPGTPLNRNPDPALATNPDPTAGAPVTPFKMTTEFAAHPGSLPQLRFGDRYRMRVRAVDLAGHSVGLTTPTPGRLAAPAAQTSLPYLRFEPVGPPVLVERTPPGPGGSHAQLVIRTRNTDPSLDSVPTAEQDERHVAPPKASVLLAEHHGMLDGPQGNVLADPATYQMITARDRATFPEAGGTPIEPATQLAVPYLPDPLARGAAMANLPNTASNTEGTIASGALSFAVPPDVQPLSASVTRVGFEMAWPDSHAFRIRLLEGLNQPSWDDGQRVLNMPIGKAETVTVPLSCYLDPQDLELLGVWGWIRELYEVALASALQDPSGAGSEVVQLTDELALFTRMVLGGGHEMITPAIDVSLVHAVQQPLGRPAWSRLPVVHQPASPMAVPSAENAFWELTAWRYAGSQHAVLLGALQVNGKSTAAVDVEATWTEWHDDLSQPGPTRTPAASHVDRIPFGSLGDGPILAEGSQTRTVAVYISEVDMLWFAAPFDQLAGVMTPGNVAAPVHELGDTKHRCIQYRATASSRFQEYFTEPGLVFTRTSDPLMVDVPSSARPLAPDVGYVVPTFGWERQETTNLKSEIRFGNGLRVYLNRPWYSSGEGELLAVVLWPATQPPPNQNQPEAPPDDSQREACKGFITQWGLDPIWQADSLNPVPAISDFSACTFSGSSLTLEEAAQTVDVAGHDVAFDEQRGLWYCDIVFGNLDAYAPFVRLALARYQPSSIAGAELSRVVLADFAQLTPTRSASLTVDPAAPTRALLVVGGPAPDGPARSVTVTVEERVAAIDSDLGWAPAPADKASASEDSPAPSQPASVLWSGVITFASQPEPGAFRVVVREFERIPVDPPGAVLSDKPETGNRLVYASILPFDFAQETKA